MKNFLIILVLGTGVHSLSIPFLSNIMDVVSLVTDISDIVTGRHDLTSGNLFKKKVDPTLAKVNELSEQINELTNTLNVKMDKLMTAVLEDVPRSIQYANLMRKLIDYVGRIDELFDDYQYYVHKSGNFTQYTIEDFSKVTTSHKYGDVQDVLKQMYHLFVPGQLDQRDKSLLDSMAATLAAVERRERCNQIKSAQQQLYDLYETVIITEIKGFIMATYSYGLLAIYHNTSFENEIQKATAQTVLRCNQYLKSVVGYIRNLPREIFLCDPPEHIYGETYVALNSFHQTIIHSSMVSESTNCENECNDLNYITSFLYRDYNFEGTTWKPNRPCSGRMSQCNDIGSTSFCEKNVTGEIVYTWIRGQRNDIYGQADDCKNGKERRLEAYQIGNNWCTTCFCRCFEDIKTSKVTRGFSMRPQMADTDENKIVTGVRFEEKDYLIHVQIEQGKLLPYGQIDKKTIKLKELEKFRYLDDVDRGGFMKVDGDKEERMKDGVDYHFIFETQYDINLDNVYPLESGWVVTGVKISRDPQFDRDIGLEIHLTPVNITSGLLEPTDDKPAKWINYQSMPNTKGREHKDRFKLNVVGLYPGTKYHDNIPDHEEFTNTWFMYSNFDEDISQHTIPFLDKRLAAPYPRVPLESVSLFHRGREQSGGFIGFAINTVDISQFLNTDMSPEAIEMFKDDYENEIINNVIEIE